MKLFLNGRQFDLSRNQLIPLIALATGEPFNPVETMLDVCCCQGGAAEGYIRAGFKLVVGVDNVDHGKRYRGQVFIQCDAVDFLEEFGSLFYFKHGSPPCQGYSIATAGNLDARAKHDRLIPTFRRLFNLHDGVWVIENVELAKSQMHNPFLLCGRMFGLTAVDVDGCKLTLDRHRLFETNVPIVAPAHPVHGDEQVAGVYGGSRRAKVPRGTPLDVCAPLDRYESRYVRKGGYVPRSMKVRQELLGIDWMTGKGMDESIPPIYAQYVGVQLRRVVG